MKKSRDRQTLGVPRRMLLVLFAGFLLWLGPWGPASVRATLDMDPLWKDFYYFNDLNFSNKLYDAYKCNICHGGLNADPAGGTALNLYGQELKRFWGGGVFPLNLKDLTDLNPKDGVPDSWDAFTNYLLGIEFIDSDKDSVLYVCDNQMEIETSYVVASHPGLYNPYTCSLDDTDEDGVIDAQDNCVNTYNPLQEDMDKDKIGDACDLDVDGDTYEGARGLNTDCDDYNYQYNPGVREICGNTVDENCDGIIAPASGDADKDGVMDCNDNCVYFVNPNQWDVDRDGVGDECDATKCGNDPDGDCCASSWDNCPNVPNPTQYDKDNDGKGDLCDCDADGDTYFTNQVKVDFFKVTICDGRGTDCVDDNPSINPKRFESCLNLYDDNCDGFSCTCNQPVCDPDFDGVPYDNDNCPLVFNPFQEDADRNGVGDWCVDCGTDCDKDGLANSSDPKPWVAPNGDVNRDGVVDLADVMLAERIASGAVATPDALSAHMADCVPYMSSAGIPDKKVTLRDVQHLNNMIQKK